MQKTFSAKYFTKLSHFTATSSHQLDPNSSITVWKSSVGLYCVDAIVIKKYLLFCCHQCHRLGFEMKTSLWLFKFILSLFFCSSNLSCLFIICTLSIIQGAPWTQFLHSNTQPEHWHQPYQQENPLMPPKNLLELSDYIVDHLNWFPNL